MHNFRIKGPCGRFALGHRYHFHVVEPGFKARVVANVETDRRHLSEIYNIAAVSHDNGGAYILELSDWCGWAGSGRDGLDPQKEYWAVYAREVEVIPACYMSTS